MNRFVLCIHNAENPASLIIGKVYRQLPDPQAEQQGLIRIIDEDTSEADGYLYPQEWFTSIELPPVAERALLAIGV